MDDLPFPFKLIAEAIAKIEYSKKIKHLIMEFRSSDHPICQPFEVRNKKYFWSKQEVWILHYKDEGKPEIKKLK